VGKIYILKLSVDYFCTGIIVGIHEFTENKRPGTNNLESKKGSEPSNIKRVSYANIAMRNNGSEEMKE